MQGINALQTSFNLSLLTVSFNYYNEQLRTKTSKTVAFTNTSLTSTIGVYSLSVQFNISAYYQVDVRYNGIRIP